MSISASLGVAVREFLLRIGSADCMLYVDCRAVSVVEDKPEGHTLIGVEPQSAKYQDLGSRFGDRPRRTEVALPHGLQTK